MRNNNNIQASAVSRFFSRSLIKELAKNGRSPLFARLLQESGVDRHLLSDDTVGSAFERAFSFLRQTDFRHEYVYKAALTHKVLLGTHSLNTASMLTEFRVGKCKADVVILNGTGTVYEIKSERDSLSRLDRQIADYRKVFASVNVIVGEKHISNVIASVPDDVGVLELSGRYQIRTIRAAQDAPERTESASIFDVITAREAGLILTELGVHVPDVPNTQRYQAYLRKFQDIAPEEAHRLMVKVLKKTRKLTHLAPVVENLPVSLQSVALSTRLSRVEFEKLFQALDVPVNEAREWAIN